MSDTYAKVVDVLVGHLGLDPEQIRPDATFEDLDVDSLSLVELAMILESDYGMNAEGINPNGTLAETAEWLEKGSSTTGVPDEVPTSDRDS